MIKGLVNSGASPTLERVIQFTGARHRVLAHSIANMDTPHFRPRDLDPREFQARLAEAVQRRRRAAEPLSGPLPMRDSRTMRFRPGGIDAAPASRDQNILFHDRNNRDLERIMQDLAENTLAHDAAVQFLRGEFDLLRTAIRERL